MNRSGSRVGLRQSIVIAASAILLLVFYLFWREQQAARAWTSAETALMQTLWLDRLPPLPADPSNKVADAPQAARLGHLLFFDQRLSRDGSVACTSCHKPEQRFTDGLPIARALGQSRRNTPSIIGTAYSPWLYWDGRKDSQWSQALAPLEDPAEHGSNRMRLARLLTEDPGYRALYEELFGAAPDFADRSHFPDDAAPGPNPAWSAAWADMLPEDQRLVSQVFANLGKALAAYERQLQPGPSRFDAYVQALVRQDEASAAELFNPDERAGLRLFIGKARCMECHNGPLFTNNEFHNTGLLPPSGQLPDQGRILALAQVRADPFNCIGEFSAASPAQCPEFRYMRTGPELIGAMRTPSLRNLGGTAPYMHKGQHATLAAVLTHYNTAPLALIGHNEAEPLGLGAGQLRQLEAFLRTLDAAPATAAQWLRNPR